jgi:hypothetical protein
MPMGHEKDAFIGFSFDCLRRLGHIIIHLTCELYLPPALRRASGGRPNVRWTSTSPIQPSNSTEMYTTHNCEAYALFYRSRTNGQD